MSDQQETKKSLPRWLVLVVVLATGGITTAAMFATGLRGPSLAWDRASKGVESVWPGEAQAASPMPVQAATPMAAQAAQPAMPATAQPVAQPMMQGTAFAGMPGPVVPVAAQPGVPIIIWGTPIGHGDRGPCTNCHSVIMPQGMPVPAISALSVMPHAYRGVCNNCHEVKVLPLGAPVAGMITVPQAGAMAGNPPKRAPTEAEWMGLEVGVAPQGVLVNGVEGMAKRAGLRVGDVIASINAVPVPTVADFVAVTLNGKLTQGAVIARREGQRLAFELGPRGGGDQPQPQQAMQMQQGMQMPQAMPMQQGMQTPQAMPMQQGMQMPQANQGEQNREPPEGRAPMGAPIQMQAPAPPQGVPAAQF